MPWTRQFLGCFTSIITEQDLVTQAPNIGNAEGCGNSSDLSYRDPAVSHLPVAICVGHCESTLNLNTSVTTSASELEPAVDVDETGTLMSVQSSNVASALPAPQGGRSPSTSFPLVSHNSCPINTFDGAAVLLGQQARNLHPSTLTVIGNGQPASPRGVPLDPCCSTSRPGSCEMGIQRVRSLRLVNRGSPAKSGTTESVKSQTGGRSSPLVGAFPANLGSSGVHPHSTMTNSAAGVVATAKTSRHASAENTGIHMLHIPPSNLNDAGQYSMPLASRPMMVLDSADVELQLQGTVSGQSGHRVGPLNRSAFPCLSTCNASALQVGGPPHDQLPSLPSSAASIGRHMSIPQSCVSSGLHKVFPGSSTATGSLSMRRRRSSLDAPSPLSSSSSAGYPPFLRLEDAFLGCLPVPTRAAGTCITSPKSSHWRNTPEMRWRRISHLSTLVPVQLQAAPKSGASCRSGADTLVKKSVSKAASALLLIPKQSSRMHSRRLSMLAHVDDRPLCQQI